eukprot:6051911-Pyramimonas_sp.AAC.1
MNGEGQPDTMWIVTSKKNSRSVGTFAGPRMACHRGPELSALGHVLFKAASNTLSAWKPCLEGGRPTPLQLQCHLRGRVLLRVVAQDLDGPQLQ